jgi:hypothetical protein
VQAFYYPRLSTFINKFCVLFPFDRIAIYGRTRRLQYGAPGLAPLKSFKDLRIIPVVTESQLSSRCWNCCTKLIPTSVSSAPFLQIATYVDMPGLGTPASRENPMNSSMPLESGNLLDPVFLKILEHWQMTFVSVDISRRISLTEGFPELVCCKLMLFPRYVLNVKDMFRFPRSFPIRLY